MNDFIHVTDVWKYNVNLNLSLFHFTALQAQIRCMTVFSLVLEVLPMATKDLTTAVMELGKAPQLLPFS